MKLFLFILGLACCVLAATVLLTSRASSTHSLAIAVAILGIGLVAASRLRG